MKKTSPRTKFIVETDITKLKSSVWDLMQLALSHDPEHSKQLRNLEMRVSILERQMERIGAPQYRRVK
jgi:hypothetical protein